MRKLFHELFYIPKHGNGKMREKAFLARITVSVCFIVLCLSAMGISAYAWFAGSIVSSSNTIQSAQFNPTVTVSIKDSSESVPVTAIADKKYQARLSAGTTYTVVLDRAESSAQTGFFVIAANGYTSTYDTQQLGVDSDNSITIYLQVATTCDVTFTACWGTSSHYDDYKTNGDNELYILKGETVTIGATSTGTSSTTSTTATGQASTATGTNSTAASSHTVETTTSSVTEGTEPTSTTQSQTEGTEGGNTTAPENAE